MQTLLPQDIIDIWDRGQGRSATVKALILLSKACPGMSADELEQMPIGERDDRLMTLRERTIGSRLECREVCPSCGEQLEFSFEVESVRVERPRSGTEALDWVSENLTLTFRLPNSSDLLVAESVGDPGTARDIIVERCVLSALRNDRAIGPEELSSEEVSALASRMAEADPQGEVILNLSCPECDRQWQALFDITRFVWDEISAQATRLLREVHVLAQAYGWRETDILAMTARRRHTYMEMLGG